MKKLVLGYDAACGTCVQTAQSVRAATEGKVDVLPLNDPEMLAWRNSFWDGQPPHAPTLIEVDGEKVKGWTGLGLANALFLRTGSRKMWAISKSLGDKRPSGTDAGPTRSTFLRGAFGAAAGFAILTGGALPARADTKSDHWLANIKISTSEEMPEASAKTIYSRMAGELRAGHAVQKVQAGRAAEVAVKAVDHQLEDGTTLRAVSVQDEKRTALVYQLMQGDEILKSHSKVFEGYASSGKGQFDRARVTLLEDDGEVQEIQPMAAGCDQNKCSAQGACFTCTCSDYDLQCMFNCCGPCGLSCGAIWSCVACVGVFCPVCAAVNRCCNKAVCGYRGSCS